MKKILSFLAVISIYILILYSNFPVLSLLGDFQRFFIAPENSDGIILNLAIGYLVSLMFYLIVVYFPERDRKKKVEQIIIEEISGVCIDALFLIINIYKNVCTTEEWDSINVKEDNEIFDDSFFERMRLFDGYALADTQLKKKEEDGELTDLTWDDRIEDHFKNFVEVLDNILATYVVYLDDRLLFRLIDFRNNKFMAYFLGLYSSGVIMKYHDFEMNKYAERISTALFRKDPEGQKTPHFRKTKEADNINMLHSYVDTLMGLRAYCLKKEKIKTNTAIQYFIDDDCGKVGTARVG